MEHISIIHTFDRDATFLVDAPVSFLGDSLALTGYDEDHEGFMHALHLPQEDPRLISSGANELCVMRVVPINGSKTFHHRFIDQCISFCRLRHRLQRTAEWIFSLAPRQLHSSTFATMPCDVDGLSRLVQPIEPTAFVAAAFALPSLLSVVCPPPPGGSGSTGGVPTPAAVAVASSLSTSPITTYRAAHGDSGGANRLLPYCFFYGYADRRGASRADLVAQSSTLPTRFAAVSNAAGVCGAASSSDSALRGNRTKIGLSLSAYLEARLPRTVSGDTLASTSADPFALWSDEVLWRLLSSLVSALAVVHAAGMHYRGEITADDVLCFALPCDAPPRRGELLDALVDGAGRRMAEWAAANQSRWVISDTTPAHRSYFTLASLPRSLFSEEPQVMADVFASQRRDVAAVGRLIVSVVEEARRRRGPVHATSPTVPPTSSGTNSSPPSMSPTANSTACSELLFVAERMTAVPETEGGVLRRDSSAHRFAQLQAIRLRTQLWLLRATVEEQQTQLSAAFHPIAGPAMRRRQEVSERHVNGGKQRSPLRPLSPPPAEATTSASAHVTVERTATESKLRERERVLTEREEKLNRFLELYELTAERLDELPVGRDSFDKLKESLRRTPNSLHPSSSSHAAPPPLSSSSQSQLQSQYNRERRKQSPQRATPPATPPQQHQRHTSPRSSPHSSPPLDNRTGPLYGLLRFARVEALTSSALPSSSPPAPRTSHGTLPSREKGLPEKALEKPAEKMTQTARGITRAGLPGGGTGGRTHQLSTTRGTPTAETTRTSSRSPPARALLHSNWRSVGGALAREYTAVNANSNATGNTYAPGGTSSGANGAAGGGRVTMQRRPKSASPSAFGRSKLSATLPTSPAPATGRTKLSATWNLPSEPRASAPYANAIQQSPQQPHQQQQQQQQQQQLLSQQRTPSRLTQRSPTAAVAAAVLTSSPSMMLSPDVSPLFRQSMEDNSSLLLSPQEKTPIRQTIPSGATFLSSGSSVRRTPPFQGWSYVNMSAPPTSTSTTPSGSALARTGLSPPQNGRVTPTRTSHHLPFYVAKANSPRHESSPYGRTHSPTAGFTSSPKASSRNRPTSVRASPVSLNQNNTPVREKGREEEEEEDIFVIRMDDSCPVNSSHETPLRQRRQRDPVHTPPFDSHPSPSPSTPPMATQANTTRPSGGSGRAGWAGGASSGVFHAAQDLPASPSGREVALAGGRTTASANTHTVTSSAPTAATALPGGRVGRKAREEDDTTPRTSRSRLADDGWVDNQLAALEQLRYDFLQSEAAKSARTTPNGKSLRGSRHRGDGTRSSPNRADEQTTAAAWRTTGVGDLGLSTRTRGMYS